MKSFSSIRPSELAEPVQNGQVLDIVDVRSPGEFATVHATGARLLPLGSLTPDEVRASRPENAVGPTYVICQSGGRSLRACAQLTQAGLKEVVNIEGGTAAWIAAGLPIVRTAGTPSSSGIPNARRFGLLLMLVCLVLAWFVHPGFAYAALGLWVVLIVAGRGACPLGACSVARPVGPNIGDKDAPQV
jgi:rhodanese-related sulfurtransferase